MIEPITSAVAVGSPNRLTNCLPCVVPAGTVGSSMSIADIASPYVVAPRVGGAVDGTDSGLRLRKADARQDEDESPTAEGRSSLGPSALPFSRPSADAVIGTERTTSRPKEEQRR